MARDSEHNANIELSRRTGWKVGHAWHRPPASRPKRRKRCRDRWMATLRRIGLIR